MRLLLLFISIFITSCTVTPDENKREVYYVQSAGASLPVIIAGADTDDVILFVHGGPGSSGLFYFYAPAWESIRKKYRMVFYDQRGSGGGRGHIEESSITVDQNIKDLDAVVASVKAKYPNSNIYLFGHSYGGMISAAYTSVHQSKIKGLMMLSPALNVVDLTTRIPANMITEFIDPYLARTDISSESRKEWEGIKQFYLDNVPLKLDSFIQHNSYVSKADDIQGLSKAGEYSAQLASKLISDPLLEPIIWGTQINKILVLLDQNGESSRNLETDPIFTLNKITVPTMLITGDSDLVVPPQSSINAFNTISSISKRAHVYTESAHNAFLEHPVLIESDITDFITDNP